MKSCPNCESRVTFVRRKDGVHATHGEPMKLFKEGADVVVPTNQQIRELFPRIGSQCRGARGA